MVIITANWFYSASDCKSSEVFSGKLTPSQLDLLQNYQVQYAAFDETNSDGAVADSMSIRIVFNGTGVLPAPQDVQRALADLAAKILNTARLSAVPDAEREEADIVLRDFLIGLYQGQYEWASEMYGGDTSLLQTWNPDVNKDNLIKLLELGCTQNGLQCLAPLMVTFAGPDARGGYQFWVEFALPDGSLFRQGPCCGEEDGDLYPTRFLFTVLKVGEKWQVQELPPYMP